ncbi:peptidase [Nocardiopsis sp. TSRI0078]|uniref:zinc metalloprotease n=1 Tax=unclassified Nocardiopsis TaxID=2649073 RepID=UPI00093A363D|nr:zinc metalloprotease [Nocardiopsis sp. TSRI0078]OKI14661.1 peptidase [Nocardiopsis sp. TSRI0078]
MCGFALTGVVAATAPDSSEHAQRMGRTVPFEECLPGTEARLTGSGGQARPPEGGELTPQEAARYHQRLREELVSLRGQELQPPQTVPVVVHVISAEDGRGDVSDERVQKQVDVLNAAYSGGRADAAARSTTSAAPAAEAEAADTGFRFELSEVTRTVNDDWFTNFDEHRDTARAQLRQGGAGTLNIYTADLGPGLLGYSTFPQDYEENPEQDGVVVAHDTLPGGDREQFNLGHTSTHEVGHWLGLFHTFQNGCTDPGDYVDDTPYEREAASGCPDGRDTCPEKEGEDPVTNFMNYSDDACMTHFTAGQGKRMVEHWAAFRGGASQARAD